MNIKTILFISLIGFITLSNGVAQTNHSFNYQGELIDSGVPANDNYDIRITMLNSSDVQIGAPSYNDNIPVSNGLFNTSVNIGGISSFDGFENYFFEVAVRKNSSGDPYTILGSPQPLMAVPLATNLVNGNATTGQVLTFDGSQWGPSSLTVTTPSPWSIQGNEIVYSTGTVKIGDISSTYANSLLVISGTDQTASFDGGDNMYVMFRENSQNRGYIGSYIDSTSNPDVNDKDFEVGTTNNNSGSLHLVTGFNQPRLTIASNGNIDIKKELTVDGNTKQLSTSNGMMKFMIKATCGSTLSSISRQYNGVSDSSVLVSISNGGSIGECIFNFPVSVSQRYWQVTALSAGNRSASCTAGSSSNKIRCTRFKSAEGTEIQGDIMLLVY